MTGYDIAKILGDSLMFTITLVCFLVPMKRKKAWGFFWLLLLEAIYRVALTLFQIKEPVLAQTYRFMFYFIYMLFRMIWFQCFTKNPVSEFLRVYAAVTIVSSLAGLLFLLFANNTETFLYLINDRPTSLPALGSRLSGSLVSIACAVPIYRMKLMQHIWNKPIGLVLGFVLLLGEMTATLFNGRYSYETVIMLCIVFQVVTIWMGMQYTGMEFIKKKVEMKNTELEREIQIKYIYYQKLGEQKEEMRKIRHDLANHLQVVRGLREKNQAEEVKKYQDRIMESYFRLEEIERAADEKTFSALRRREKSVKQSRYRGLNIVLISNSVLLTVSLAAIRFWDFSPKTAIIIEIIFCGCCLVVSICRIYGEKRREKALDRHFSSGMERQDDKELIYKLYELIRKLPELSVSEETAFMKEIEHYQARVFTGNQAVDVMLSQKAVYYRENAISFECKIALPQEGMINPADLIGLLGNLLDNAAEACMRCPGERFIYLESRTQPGVFLIKVVNSKPLEEHEGKTGYITQKIDKEAHGIGMKIVAEIVKSYGGIVEYHEESTQFTAAVSLLQKKGE